MDPRFTLEKRIEAELKSYLENSTARRLDWMEAL